MNWFLASGILFCIAMFIALSQFAEGMKTAPKYNPASGFILVASAIGAFVYLIVGWLL